jgi:hypothetical protein
VACRDNSGSVSQGIFQLQVVQIPPRPNQRNLLLVDDFPLGPGSENVGLVWDRKWEEILEGSVVDFQRNDIIDAQADAARIRFATITEYKSVIWFAAPGDDTFVHTRLAPQARDAPRYNWLEIYQAQVGNILYTGPGAARNTIERSPFRYPVIFNVPAGGDLGFGQDTRADGSTYNRGTLRWPYSGWCIESLDFVRPALNYIYGENPSLPLRDQKCDQLVRAVVADEFIAAYPDAVGRVRDLVPLRLREERDPYHKFPFEEFYNVNTTRRRVSLVLRSCQVPMYRHIARRDAGLVADPQTECSPPFRERSPLDQVPVGIASSRYADTKQLTGSEDFLWGFHPLAFEIEDVKDSILWILQDRWQVDIRR